MRSGKKGTNAATHTIHLLLLHLPQPLFVSGTHSPPCPRQFVCIFKDKKVNAGTYNEGRASINSACDEVTTPNSSWEGCCRRHLEKRSPPLFQVSHVRTFSNPASLAGGGAIISQPLHQVLVAGWHGNRWVQQNLLRFVIRCWIVNLKRTQRKLLNL